MKIAFGCDHAGYSLKEEVFDYLNKKGYEIIDCGTDSYDSVDYPVYGEAAARKVASGEADFGIVICGTGIGISLAANKVKGIRCALLSDTFSAKATRQHNDANMMALGSRVIGPGLAIEIIDAFLSTPFSQAQRHQKRIDMLMDIENR